MTATITETARTARIYSVEQQAARDYMEANAILTELANTAKRSKAIQTSALAILAAKYGKGLTPITGCWNVTLDFRQTISDSTSYAKVLAGLRPHLTDMQAQLLDNLTGANTKEKITNTLKEHATNKA